MKHTIVIQNMVATDLAPSLESIETWANSCLSDNDVDETELTIRIVDKPEIIELNQQFRHKGKATNVLSFPFDAPKEIVPEEQHYLGDIVICADVVNQEAQQQHKTKDAHWAHMIIHGIYHLLGYDHMNDQEAGEMEALEIQSLKKLGFNNPYNAGEHIESHE